MAPGAMLRAVLNCTEMDAAAVGAERRVGVKPGLPPWGPHVRFRRVQTLVREGVRLVKLRNSALRAGCPSSDRHGASVAPGKVDYPNNQPFREPSPKPQWPVLFFKDGPLGFGARLAEGLVIRVIRFPGRYKKPRAYLTMDSLPRNAELRSLTKRTPSRTNVCTRRKRTCGPQGGSPGLTPTLRSAPTAAASISVQFRTAPSTATSSSPPSRLSPLSGNSGGLDSVSPTFDVAPQQFCQITWAPVLRRRDAHSKPLQSLAHGWRVECLGRCLIEPVDDRPGRPLREKKSAPDVDSYFRGALLPGGCKIRQHARAAGRQNGDGLHGIALNLRQRSNDGVAHEVETTSDQVLHRRCVATIGDVRGLRTHGKVQQHARHVADRPGPC